jgi:hypothetical protein
MDDAHLVSVMERVGGLDADFGDAAEKVARLFAVQGREGGGDSVGLILVPTLRVGTKRVPLCGTSSVVD